MAERKITLEPQTSEVVSFTAVPREARDYMVEVADLTGSFRALLPPAPDIRLSNLVIEPKRVYVGQTVSIKAVAENIGAIGGLVPFICTVDGITSEQSISLEPSESGDLEFTATPNQAREYIVDVGMLRGTFEAVPLPPVCSSWQYFMYSHGRLATFEEYYFMQTGREVAGPICGGPPYFPAGYCDVAAFNFLLARGGQYPTIEMQEALYMLQVGYPGVPFGASTDYIQSLIDTAQAAGYESYADYHRALNPQLYSLCMGLPGVPTELPPPEVALPTPPPVEPMPPLPPLPPPSKMETQLATIMDWLNIVWLKRNDDWLFFSPKDPGSDLDEIRLGETAYLNMTKRCELSHMAKSVMFEEGWNEIVWGASTTANPVAPFKSPEADMRVRSVKIYDDVVYVGNRVTIWVIVANLGLSEGSRLVRCEVNGTILEQTATVSPCNANYIWFKPVAERAGHYTVRVDGLSTTFEAIERA